MGGQLDLDTSWQPRQRKPLFSCRSAGGGGGFREIPLCFKCLVRTVLDAAPSSLYKCIRNNSGSFLGSIVSVRG